MLLNTNHTIHSLPFLIIRTAFIITPIDTGRAAGSYVAQYLISLKVSVKAMFSVIGECHVYAARMVAGALQACHPR